MITLSPTSTTTASFTAEQLASSLLLIQALANPQTIIEYCKQLQDECAKLQTVIDSADAVKADIQAQRDRHVAEVQQERDALTADRAAFNRKCALAMEEAKAREAESARLNAEAQAAYDAAITMRDDLESRLSKIKAAAA